MVKADESGFANFDGFVNTGNIEDDSTFSFGAECSTTVLDGDTPVAELCGNSQNSFHFALEILCVFYPR